MRKQRTRLKPIAPSTRVAQVKSAVRRRDGYRCVDCGMTDARHRKQYGSTLEVHRTDPGSTYDTAGCVTLCLACHDKRPTSLHVRSLAALRSLSPLLGDLGDLDLEGVRNFPSKGSALLSALARALSKRAGEKVTKSLVLYALALAAHRRILGDGR